MEENWKFKEVLRGKTLLVLVLSVILTAVLTKLCNWGLQVTVYRNEIYYRQINLFCELILFVIAIVITGNVLKAFLNIKGVKNDVRVSDAIQSTTAKNFKWSVLYSVLIGYVLMGVCLLIGNKIIDVVLNSQESTLIHCLVVLGTIVVSIALPIKLSKLINKKMIKMTHTNEKLVEAISAGVLYQDFPERHRNQADMEAIANLLKSGSATSLNGAIWLYDILTICKKLMKSMFIVFVIPMLILLVLSSGAINVFSKDLERSIKGY